MMNSIVSGVGGRSQEMTLGFEYVFLNLLKRRNAYYAVKLESLEQRHFEVVFSSFGTDGIDGPTDNISLPSKTELDFAGFNMEDMKSFLLKHDSYNYFAKNNRLVKTGPTGTNVSDLQVLLLHSN